MMRWEKVFVAFTVVTLLASFAAAEGGFPQPEFGVECQEGQEPVFLNYGEHTEGCALETIFDIDSFQFAGSEGERIQIRTFAVFNERVEIRDPDQNLVAGNLENLVLPQTGIYTIFFSDFGADQGGSYTLEIERLPPISAPCVSYGIFSVTDVIDRSTDTDFVSFQGTAGTRVRLTFVSGGSGTYGYSVHRENWDIVLNTSCSGTCQTDLLIPDDGTYFIMIRNGNAPRAYQINIQCVIGGCPDKDPVLSVVLDLPVDSISIATSDIFLVDGSLVNGAMQPLRSVLAFAWIEKPDGIRVSIVPPPFQGAVSIPPGFDFNVSRPFGTAGMGILSQIGDYEIGTRLVDSTTGRVLTADLASFSVVP